MPEVKEQPQWCVLCWRNHRATETLSRRVYGQPLPERLMVCPACIKVLRKTGLLRPAMWGRHECWEWRADPRPDPTSAYAALLTRDEATVLRASGIHVSEAKENNAT